MTIADSYKMQSMLDAVDLRPNNYSFLGPEWFREKGIKTSSFWYDLRVNGTTAIPPSAPGAPGTTVLRNRANQIQLKTAHYKTTDYIEALEAENVRKFGSTANQIPADILMELIDRHADYHDVSVFVAKIKSLFDGVMMGPPLEKGGAPQAIFDYYTNGGLGAQYSLNMALSSEGLLAKCATIKREMAKRARGVVVGKPIAYAGATMFDAVRAHDEFIKGVERWNDGEYLRNASEEVDFGGIIWKSTEETYVDHLGATVRYVPTNEARVVAAGLPAMTELVVSPAATVDEVSKLGRLKHLTQAVRSDRSGWDMWMQSRFAAVNKRPDLVFKLTNT